MIPLLSIDITSDFIDHLLSDGYLLDFIAIDLQLDISLLNSIEYWTLIVIRLSQFWSSKGNLDTRMMLKKFVA